MRDYKLRKKVFNDYPNKEEVAEMIEAGGGSGGGMLENFWTFNPKGTIPVVSNTKIGITTQEIQNLYSPKLGDQFILKVGTNEIHVYISRLVYSSNQLTGITLMDDPRGHEPVLTADTNGLNAQIIFKESENTFITEKGYTISGDNITGQVGSQNYYQINLIPPTSI